MNDSYRDFTHFSDGEFGLRYPCSFNTVAGGTFGTTNSDLPFNYSTPV